MSDEQWQKTIAIDLDGTLAEYHGWTGEWTPIGDPLPGAWEFCRALRVAGWRIIIHTCRGDLEAVRTWLNAWTIAHDGINCTAHNAEGSSAKPIADVYLDDRAVRFEGDFAVAWLQIAEAEGEGPWWERDGGPSPARGSAAHSAPPPGDRCAVSGGRGAKVTATTTATATAGV